MSIFFPYKIIDVITGLEQLFGIELNGLSEYQETVLTIGANIYFLIFWFFILYFSVKSINWVYERLC